MKPFATLLLSLLAITTQAQNNYAEAIRQGDNALRSGQYKVAINKYFAAEAFDPSKKAVVQEKVNAVFDRIEALRTKAERAFVQVKEEQVKTQKALNRADKLVNAFFFYSGRFALAYKDDYYYFIDKNGDIVEKLGRWEKASQFNDFGYALVSPWDSDTTVTFSAETYEEWVQIRRAPSNDQYFLDTLGRRYLVTTDEEDKKSWISVVYKAFSEIKTVPESIFDGTNLKLLWLNDNDLEQIPPEIGRSKNLEYLDLSGNKLAALPPEIGALENLEYLDLSSNKLTTLPPALGDLKSLRILKLGNNPLSELPAEIWNLQNLEHLDLEGTELSELPMELINLKNLKVLNVKSSHIWRNLAILDQAMPNCNIIKSISDGSLSLALEMFGDYAQAYYFQKKVVNRSGKNYSNWLDLSRMALFVNEPREAINAARETLELKPNAHEVETYLALGYLLNDQWFKAEKICRKWKGKRFTDIREGADTFFLRTITNLEEAGITHPDFEKVRALFAK